MNKKLILLFSHKLTEKQKQNAENKLGVSVFVSMPINLQQTWSNVPPDLEDISEYFAELRIWLIDIVDPGDYILIQGDFGATVMFVNWAFNNSLIPVYSTTKRIHQETTKTDGTIEIRKTFQHEKFRKYNKIRCF